MSEKKFNFDVPKEKMDELDELTNKKTPAGDSFSYQHSVPGEKDAYEGKKNEEVLKEKRLEFIDKAILDVVEKNKEIVDVRKKMLEEGNFDAKTIKDDLWQALGNDISTELERKGQVFGANASDQERKEHMNEFSGNVVQERFDEWDFLSNDDVPKLNSVESSE